MDSHQNTTPNALLKGGTQSDVALGLTQLTPKSLVALIPGSKEDEYLGTDTIEIDCEGRHKDTTPEEETLLSNNGYARLFDYQIVGWDMWVKADQAKISSFFSGRTLPIPKDNFDTAVVV